MGRIISLIILYTIWVYLACLCLVSSIYLGLFMLWLAVIFPILYAFKITDKEVKDERKR